MDGWPGMDIPCTKTLKLVPLVKNVDLEAVKATAKTEHCCKAYSEDLEHKKTENTSGLHDGAGPTVRLCRGLREC